MKVVLSLFLAVAMSVLFAGCRTTHVQSVETHASAASVSAMEKAITEGARERGWAVSKIKPGEMEATLKVRSHVLVVTIPYNAQGYQILYKSSENLKYDPSDNSIHSNYQGWVRNLDKSILRNLEY